MRAIRHPAVRLLLALGALALAAVPARADLSIAIVHADTAGSSMDLQAKLFGTGLFAHVDLVDAGSIGGTPSLSQLLHYDAVLSYTNYAPDDTTGLGNVLGAYADAGRGLVLGGYGLGNVLVGGGGTAFGGRISGPGYSPLVISANLGDLDGGILATAPGDPIFAGVDLTVPDFYYHDSSFARFSLDAGAALLATDTSGVDLIARSANGRILALNLFPGTGLTDNSDQFTKLLANGLMSVAGTTAPAVPGPPAVVFMAQAGLIGLGLVRSRRRAGPPD